MLGTASGCSAWPYAGDVRRLPLSLVLSTVAVAWAVALIGVAVWVPAYSGSEVDTSCSATGCTTTSASSTETLVEVNGERVLVIVAALVALALICWLGLHVHRTRGMRAGLVAGWIAAVATLALAAVSFGLGVLVAPMAIMMVVAAATTPTQPAATRRSAST